MVLDILAHHSNVMETILKGKYLSRFLIGGQGDHSVDLQRFPCREDGWSFTLF